jgi:hypothetical protein
MQRARLNELVTKLLYAGNFHPAARRAGKKSLGAADNRPISFPRLLPLVGSGTEMGFSVVPSDDGIPVILVGNLEAELGDGAKHAVRLCGWSGRSRNLRYPAVVRRSGRSRLSALLQPGRFDSRADR